MTNSYLRQWVRLDKQGETFPTKRSSLATSIQPFEQYPGRLIQEGMYCTGIERHSIILDVPPQLRAEYRPDIVQPMPTTNHPAPGIDRLQFGAKSVARGFHLRHRNTLPRSSPVKGKSQKIEDVRPTLIATRTGKVNQPGLLLVQSKFVPG